MEISKGICCVELQQMHQADAASHGCCEMALENTAESEPTHPSCDCDLKKYMERATSLVAVPHGPSIEEMEWGSLFDLSPWLTKEALAVEGIVSWRGLEAWRSSLQIRALRPHAWLQVWLI